MLDLRRIRTEPEVVVAELARRGMDTSDIGHVLDLDELQRRLGAQRDELRAEVKSLSKQVGQLHRDGRSDEAEAVQAKSRSLGEKEQELATEAAMLSNQVRDLLLRIPNTPHPDSPEGSSDADNPVVRIHGYDPDHFGDHQRIAHWDLGTQYGILDNERAVKISGAMFTMQRKGGATLASLSMAQA